MTYAFAVGQGRVAQGTAPNLSDFFVPQYLSGHIGMRPADFEWTLCLTDSTHVPFSTRGLRNHYIIIPAALLSDKPGLQMAITLELRHMRQSDVGWEIGLKTLRLMFFWNPVFHVRKRAVDRLRELACDQQLLARGRFGPVAYSDCLLRICRNGL